MYEGAYQKKKVTHGDKKVVSSVVKASKLGELASMQPERRAGS